MDGSLVTKRHLELPKEYERFFIPPLVWNEKREDYDVLFDGIAMALQPEDIIQWLTVKEYADISWELQRERRIKAEIIMLNQEKCRSPSGMALTRADLERHKALDKNPSAFTKRDSKPIVPDEQSKSWLAEAYILGRQDIEIIDTRIASYMFRRDAALRHNERYVESLVRKNFAG
jgi:hypothetical protein